MKPEFTDLMELFFNSSLLDQGIAAAIRILGADTTVEGPADDFIRRAAVHAFVNELTGEDVETIRKVLKQISK